MMLVWHLECVTGNANSNEVYIDDDESDEFLFKRLDCNSMA
jgi:hypothetical protein